MTWSLGLSVICKGEITIRELGPFHLATNCTWGFAIGQTLNSPMLVFGPWCLYLFAKDTEEEGAE